MPKFRSLRANLLAIGVPLALVLFAVLVGAFESFNLSKARTALLEKLVQFSASQSLILAETVAARDAARVELMVAAAIADPDVRGIAVYDVDGGLIDAYGDGWETPGELTRRTRITFATEAGFGTVGTLVIALSDERVSEAALARLLYEAVLALLLLGAGIWSALYAHRRTVGLALERLLHAFGRAEREGVREPVEWHGEDEVGRVVGAYNALQRSQADYEARLRGAQADLERRVEMRTAELSDANRKLREEIAERERAERELERLAHHDALTGLPNRSLLHNRLEQALQRAQRSHLAVAVLFLDLDRFKLVNDTFGHEFGDRLLRAVADRLRDCLRLQDTLARLGGDEFVIVVDDLVHAEDAAVVTRKIMAALENPIVIDGHEAFVSTSVGVSLYPQDGETNEELVKHADAAMYRAKERGRRTVVYYHRDLSRSMHERFSLETDLRRALERGELEIHYQAQVRPGSGLIVGAEALLRWRHATRGLLGPDVFLAAARDTGLMVEIGEWVIRGACRQGRAWRDQGLDRVRIAINLSEDEINRGHLLATIESALGESGLEPADLEFELTESFLLRHPEANIGTLSALRDLGLGIAIDDFGTGYSSLSYLKQLPIRKLKMDRSFVHDVPADAEDVAIIRAIIQLGHSLGLVVTAEGVETEAQRAFLVEEGCDELQGNLLYAPCPPAAFALELQRASEMATALRPRGDAGAR